ncbi:hypothetical protein [Rhodococcus sp. IEGM 1318]|uniref:hypothetical protein n=1 Tax=Rhodococcus sp. IEGM 1318 TaxID=3082226 RepID=UPI0029557644|nr:hypothetical protein [Rhodococcus sp. IEGM 1318]MDV8009204.1 hypothetical protein [Rhodococcus sp. IEGM 1318]
MSFVVSFDPPSRCKLDGHRGGPGSNYALRLEIADRAIQMHGVDGVAEGFPLAASYAAGAAVLSPARDLARFDGDKIASQGVRLASARVRSEGTHLLVARWHSVLSWVVVVTEPERAIVEDSLRALPGTMRPR